MAVKGTLAATTVWDADALPSYSGHITAERGIRPTVSMRQQAGGPKARPLGDHRSSRKIATQLRERVSEHLRLFQHGIATRTFEK